MVRLHASQCLRTAEDSQGVEPTGGATSPLGLPTGECDWPVGNRVWSPDVGHSP